MPCSTEFLASTRFFVSGIQSYIVDLKMVENLGVQFLNVIQ